MISDDFLFGAFDQFETNVRKLQNGYYEAEALGVKVTAVDSEQAVNDLNAKLMEKMERGEIVPNMGN